MTMFSSFDKHEKDKHDYFFYKHEKRQDNKSDYPHLMRCVKVSVTSSVTFPPSPSTILIRSSLMSSTLENMNMLGGGASCWGASWKVSCRNTKLL